MNTKQAMQKAFIEMYSQMDYNNITIKELCLRAPVARTTFYSHYQNVDDLKADIETGLLDKIRNITHKFEASDLALIDLHEFFKHMLLFIEDNWKEIYVFLVVQPNVRFIKLWKEEIKRHISSHYPQKVNCQNYELLAELISSSAIWCFCYRVQHPDEINDERLFALVQTAIASMVHAL